MVGGFWKGLGVSGTVLDSVDSLDSNLVNGYY